MAIQLKRRSDTATNWSSTNPILSQGEIGVDLTNSIFKIGNGTTAWNSLAIAPTASPTQIKPLRSLGDGGDGNATISSGTTILTRDMYYNNLTLNGSGQLNTNGFRIFVKGILDLSQATTGAISFNGANGGNASGATLGSGATVIANGSIGGIQAGGNGATGTTGVGATGVAGTTGNNGGTGGGAGIAGTSGTNAGGAASAGATAANPLWIRRWETLFIRGITIILSGSGGRGGSSGGGDGTNTGGGGGGGGGSGGIIAIYANIVLRSNSTSPGAIQANGGMGGNGGTVSTGVTGGGSGGGGGGGGWVYLAYNSLVGPSITNFIQANGGAGGNGGAGFGTTNPTLSGGSGGQGGYGGRITLFNIPAAVGVERYGDSNTLINPEVTTGINSIAAFGMTAGSGGDPGLAQVTI